MRRSHLWRRPLQIKHVFASDSTPLSADGWTAHIIQYIKHDALSILINMSAKSAEISQKPALQAQAGAPGGALEAPYCCSTLWQLPALHSKDRVTLMSVSIEPADIMTNTIFLNFLSLDTAIHALNGLLKQAITAAYMPPEQLRCSYITSCQGSGRTIISTAPCISRAAGELPAATWVHKAKGCIRNIRILFCYELRPGISAAEHFRPSGRNG